MSVFVIATLLFWVVNIAVYSFYFKTVLNKSIVLYDLFHYSIVVMISTAISLISMHIMGMKM